ncbi:phosphatase PAP2 family protein [Vibrio astriarenae]
MEFFKKELSQYYSCIVENTAFYAVVFICTTCNVMFLFYLGYADKVQLFSYSKYLDIALGFTALVYLVFSFFKVVLEREQRPLLRMIKGALRWLEHRDVIISTFLLIVAVSIFMSSYSAVKASIPMVNHFRYDVLFYNIDKLFFLGFEPWAILPSFLDVPYFYAFINLLYNIWVIFIWASVVYFGFLNSKDVRLQYLITFVLCWFIVGNILAMLLSSAGPIYMHLVNDGETMYISLIEHLKLHDSYLIENDSPITIWALSTQELLWESYSQNKEMLGSGISAMPSMHVSMSVLLALGVSKVNKWAGYSAWIYCFFIYIGSFLLGWHYAIDGLVSLPCTLLLWYLSGKGIRYFSRADKYSISKEVTLGSSY